MVFYSLHPSGETDEYSLHAGCEVKQGTKWSANKWSQSCKQVSAASANIHTHTVQVYLDGMIMYDIYDDICIWQGQSLSPEDLEQANGLHTRVKQSFRLLKKCETKKNLQQRVFFFFFEFFVAFFFSPCFVPTKRREAKLLSRRCRTWRRLVKKRCYLFSRLIRG